MVNTDSAYKLQKSLEGLNVQDTYRHASTLIFYISDPIKHREKRSVMSEHEYQSMVYTKTTYILTLSNAGLKQSYEHIASYANHTETPISWRRSALHGLTKFSTPQVSVRDEYYVLDF